jgi:hypothetical protein
VEKIENWDFIHVLVIEFRTKFSTRSPTFFKRSRLVSVVEDVSI